MTEHFKIRSKRYATVVSRWLLIAALVFAAIMTSGVYITDHVLTRVYSATAALQVQTPAENAVAYSGWAFPTPQSRTVQAELESVESPEILQAAVSGLSLDKAWATRVFDRSDPLTSDEALHYLKSHLRPKFKHNTNVIEVTALSDDPKEASEIANEIAALYQAAHAGPVGKAAAASPNTVKILSQATIPLEPTAPNKRFCYAITAAIAGMLGVMIASSVEICLLIARAEEASRELTPAK